MSCMKGSKVVHSIHTLSTAGLGKKVVVVEIDVAMHSLHSSFPYDGCENDSCISGVLMAGRMRVQSQHRCSCKPMCVRCKFSYILALESWSRYSVINWAAWKFNERSIDP
jgi:hypothetical protein